MTHMDPGEPFRSILPRARPSRNPVRPPSRDLDQPLQKAQDATLNIHKAADDDAAVGRRILDRYRAARQNRQFLRAERRRRS